MIVELEGARFLGAQVNRKEAGHQVTQADHTSRGLSQDRSGENCGNDRKREAQ